MHSSLISRLVRRFARDERGAFAVMFGVMAIVLIALGGAVVDFVSLQQNRNQAQLALDAAALALQPRIFEPDFDEAEVLALAQAFLNERISAGQVTADITDIEAIIEDGSLYFQAMVHVPTAFVRLVGVNNLDAAIEAEATRKKLALEVVMVLDNSGSMLEHSRMSYLKSAARCATNTLFYDEVETGTDPNSCVPTATAEPVENVKMGVVPFTMFVNVGSGNANQPWIDRFGASSISNDNFDNDDDEEHVTSISGYGWPNRFSLFTAAGESWRGCVEARPHTATGASSTSYLDTDDTPPVAGDTLFVPMFSPDMASSTGGNNYTDDSPAVCDRPAQGNTRCTITETRYCQNGQCTGATQSAGVPTGPENFLNNTILPGGIYGKRPPACSCRSGITYGNWTGGTTQTRTLTCKSYIPEGLSPREYQERMCKYYAGVSGSNFSRGPNADCVRTPIRELVDDPDDVLSTITAMQAEGGTNIHAGTIWGFRVISPGAPFEEGAEYDEATSKVMIIMTDGENTAYNLSTHCSGPRTLNGSCYNSAYGFPYNSRNTTPTSTSGGNVERLGQMNAANATLVAAMNERTSQTCANAKAAGITIYTIGLSTDHVTQSTPEVVRAMLSGCASTPGHAYFPEDPSELKDVFASIANELSALRLAR